MTQTPKRPYLVRALHDWLTDNDYTPYLLVDATHQDLLAPTEYAQNGQLVLNANLVATHNLVITNDEITFSARFGGVSKDLYIPMAAVLGIFAKEDRTQALFFDPSEYANLAPAAREQLTDAEQSKKQSKEQSKGKPTLKLIK